VLNSVGVALLPFVDEQRLLKGLEMVYPDLEDDESKSHSSPMDLSTVPSTVSRNSRGCSELFVHQSHRVASMIRGLYEEHPDGPSDQVGYYSVLCGYTVVGVL